MNTQSSRHRSRYRLLSMLISPLLVLGLLATPLSLSVTRQAHAVTAAEKQAEVDEAFKRLDTLQTEINQLSADYNDAMLAHAEAEARMYDAQEREDAARVRIGQLQALLGERAQQMYRSGSGSYMDVLLGATTFTEFITAVDMLSRINQQNAQLVVETKQVKQEAEAARVEYTAQEQIARENQELIGRIKIEKQETEAALQIEIANLQNEAADLLAKEILEAEAARRAAEAAQRAAEAAAANTGVGSAGTVSEDQMARIYALNFQYPFETRQTISSGFGWRSFDSSFHLGVDFAAPGGTPILSIGTGTVAAAGWHSLMGNYVIIAHGSGVRSIYMHASALNVSAGDAVVAGDILSFVGTTGNSTGNHLHLQIEVDLVAVNPMLFYS